MHIWGWKISSRSMTNAMPTLIHLGKILSSLQLHPKTKNLNQIKTVSWQALVAQLATSHTCHHLQIRTPIMICRCQPLTLMNSITINLCVMMVQAPVIRINRAISINLIHRICLMRPRKKWCFNITHKSNNSWGSRRLRLVMKINWEGLKVILRLTILRIN